MLTRVHVLIDGVKGSDGIEEDKENDGKGEVDEVSEIFVVKDVFELGLYFVEEFANGFDGENNEHEGEGGEGEKEIIDKCVHYLHHTNNILIIFIC